MIVGQLFIVQNLHFQIEGVKVPQDFFYLRREPFFNGVLFEYIVAMQHQCGIFQIFHIYFVEPCIDGGLRQLLLQPVKYLLP